MTEPQEKQNSQFIERFILLLLLIPFLVTQYLNHTGFCYADLKYPNEREIVDRYLFEGKEKDMTFEDKVAYVKENYGGVDYQSSFVYDGLSDLDYMTTKGVRIFISLFYNHANVSGHSIAVFLPQGVASPPSIGDTFIWEEKPPYSSKLIYTDSCGKRYWRRKKINFFDKDEYKERLFLNKKYWEHYEAGTVETGYKPWRQQYYQQKYEKSIKEKENDNTNP